MQVKLRVVGGKNDGREIKIAVPKFIIGRGEQAHLRPSSDLISRQHCAVIVEDGKVTVEDLGSRNGTIVNEEQLDGPHTAKMGDILKVGRLQFEIVIDHAQAGLKKPMPESVAEVAKRTASTKPKGGGGLEDSITDWLSEPAAETQRDINETRQFRLDETSTEIMESPKKQDAANDSSDEPDTGEDPPSGVFQKKKKKQVGKLPPRPKYSSETSTTAADDVLKKFFNRR